MKVVFAPDSFKGSLGSVAVAEALAAGWCTVRKHDVVVALPQADGGEWTLEVIAAAVPSMRWYVTEDATGPDHRRRGARWLMDAGRHAVVELAESSGIALMAELDPLGATSRGLGEVIGAALSHGAQSITVALGGSASTDGGAGALRALGLEVNDSHGAPVGEGAFGMLDAVSIDSSHLRALPSGGLELLTDTTAMLRGRRGAAEVFGPQKGASTVEIATLDRGLQRWAAVLAEGGMPADPNQPGAGAAGGVGFGLLAWGGFCTPGAARVSELTGLVDHLDADLIVTGEGRFDSTSLTGKLVGHVLGLCADAGVRAQVVAGQVAEGMSQPAMSLTALAGTPANAERFAAHWLRAAGAALAQGQPD